MNYRRRSAPVSTLRAKLQQRLVEKNTGDDDDIFVPGGEPAAGRPLFPAAALKTMHRYFLLKTTVAVVLVLLAAVLIKGDYGWGGPLLQALRHVVEWNLDPGILSKKAEPAFQLFLDRLKVPADGPKVPLFSGRSILPLPGSLQSGFGLRTCPESGREEMHYGIDLTAPEGTAVKTLLEGRVEQIIPGNGSVTIVTVSEPGWTMIYRGVAAAAVKEGEVVDKGALLGSLGQARRYELPHLHLELRYGGRPVPPPAGWAACFAVPAGRI